MKLKRISLIKRLQKSHRHEPEHSDESSTSSVQYVRDSTLEARGMLGEMADIIKDIPDAGVRVALDYLANSIDGRIRDAGFAFD